jgi:integrase
MRKTVEENERVKRDYITYLEHTKGMDEASTEKILDALLRFEQSTGFKPFKAFHIDQAIKFKSDLAKAKNKRTGGPLSVTTVDATLACVRSFFLWLAGQHGYRARISYSDAEYFRNKRKASRAAHAERDVPFPSMEAAYHAFQAMPESTIFEMRNKALFAFFLLTGARVGALASLRLKHVNLFEGHVFQDGREVKTKASKTIDTWFFPVNPEYRECFIAWVGFLRTQLFFGLEDPLFPKPEITCGESGFEVKGLSRMPYSSGAKLNKIVRGAFATVQLPEYTPHAFRKTLAVYGDQVCTTMAERKMWSMNLGHEHMATTIDSYIPVSKQKRSELMREVAARLGCSKTARARNPSKNSTSNRQFASRPI